MSIYSNFEIHILELPAANTPVKFPAPEKYGDVRQPLAILVQSPTVNTTSIWIGKSNVDATLTNGGWEVPRGGDSYLPSNKDEQMYAVADQDNQKLIITYLAEKVI